MQLGVPRWRNSLIFKISFCHFRPPPPIWPPPQQLASFHYTPPCLAKWKTKFVSDIKDPRPSKTKSWTWRRWGSLPYSAKTLERLFLYLSTVHYPTYIRYATRQKRSDSKRALRNLLYNFNADNSSFENKFSLDEDEADDSDIGRKKDKRRIRSHYKKMKRKLKREKFDDGFEGDSARTFQAIFGNRCYTWSFGRQREESDFHDSTTGFGWRDNSNRTYSRNDKWANESDAESDNESCSYVVGSSSDRTLLGLPASGPLKIEDVKNAFRLSALKWHPDKHQGSGQDTFAVAEEKFKCCVTAYKSLCSALSSAVLIIRTDLDGPFGIAIFRGNGSELRCTAEEALLKLVLIG